MELKDLENMSEEQFARVVGVLAKGKYDLVRCTVSDFVTDSADVSADKLDLVRTLFTALMGDALAKKANVPVLYKCLVTFSGVDPATKEMRTVTSTLPKNQELSVWLEELISWNARFLTIDGAPALIDPIRTEETPFFGYGQVTPGELQ